MTVVFFVASLLFLFLAQHPFITYPLTLMVIRRVRYDGRPERQAIAWSPQSVALCVCAYNEERVIAAKVENMLTIRRRIPNLEILVYVDAATDATAEILAGYGDQIRVLISSERQGKTAGMNALVGSTSAEYIVFTDANTMYTEETVPSLLQPFADNRVGCVCGHLIYTSATGGPTAQVGSLYWRNEEWIKELESRTGSVMGATGSIFAVRRQLHKPPPAKLFEDMYVSLSILCDGHRVVHANDAVAYEEVTAKSEEEFKRKVRIGCMSFNVHLTMHSRIMRLGALDLYKYFSHRLVRWFTIYLVVAGAVSFVAAFAAAGEWLAVLLLVTAGAAIGLIAWIWPVGPFGRVREIFAAFLATGIGVWQSIRGVDYQTWTPVSSARHHVQQNRSAI